MRVHRFYCSKNRFNGRHVTIVGPPLFHLRNVLRYGVGDSLILFDGTGSEVLVKIQSIDKQQASCLVSARRQFPQSSLPSIHVAIGITKSKIFDVSIQKATELGAATIQPVRVARSAPNKKEKMAENQERRWQQIAMDAAAQCGRLTLPEILPTKKLATYSSGVSGTGFKVILTPHHSSAVDLRHRRIFEQVFVLVGPEGGFLDEEVEESLQFGFEPLSIGPRIMRAETAVVSGLTLLQHHVGDLDEPRVEPPWIEM